MNTNETSRKLIENITQRIPIIPWGECVNEAIKAVGATARGVSELENALWAEMQSSQLDVAIDKKDQVIDALASYFHEFVNVLRDSEVFKRVSDATAADARRAQNILNLTINRFHSRSK